MEHERKWTITGEHPVPSRFLSGGTEIEQFYVAIKPEREVRVRVRHYDSFTERTLTVKTGTGEKRGEATIEIGEDDAKQLKRLREGQVIRKTRYANEGANGHVFEIDVYHNIDLPEGRAVVEIEDPPEDFLEPRWFGTEVTEDERFKNKNLVKWTTGSSDI